MAGGEGGRLRPLTCNIPKPMMPILDKPIMEYTIELLKNSGIKDIAVTLQYLPDEIIRYFGDGKDFGVNIRYFIEEFPLGTAGSIKNVEEYIDDTFIVISGDALTDIDLIKAIEHHNQKNAFVTVVLKKVSIPLEYGVVVTNKDGQIAAFLEKPSWSEVFSDKANTGIYIIEPEVFNFIEKNQKCDFSNDLFPMLLHMNKCIYGYVAEGYWCDIGNINQYMRCQYDVLKGNVKVNIKGQKYKDEIWIGDNCEICSTARIISPAFIGNNCSIYDNVEIGPYSILGKSNIVSNNSVIRRSIIFDNCYIGSNAEIKGGVISNKVQLESRVSIFEGSIIGEETLIRERTIVKPGIKVWPNKILEAGTVVNANIIWGDKLSKSIFGNDSITGEVNVDVTPEFVSKLGTAYGALFNLDSKIALSCSNSEAAQMFKYALASGLLSIGIEVYDLKIMTTAMARQATVFFGVQGAIHVLIDTEEPQKVKIIFMDQNGLNIDKNMQRKIETRFMREDFRRIRTDGFKKLFYINDCVEYYIRQLINQAGVHRIKSQKFNLIINVDNLLIKSILEKLFTELRINAEFITEPIDMKDLKIKVLNTCVNLGIIIKNERLFCIIDDKGNFIKDEFLEAIKSLVILKTFNLSTLVVPVTASSILEYVAQICGVKFMRAKISQKNILETYLKNERELSRREILNAYLMALDDLGILLLILDLIAGSDRFLSEIMLEFPKFYSYTTEIDCPWNMRGTVMRVLIEESLLKSVDMIEGVRLNYDNSWALVLPDADEPICKIYTEAKTEREAIKLQEIVADKIVKLLNSSEFL